MSRTVAHPARWNFNLAASGLGWVSKDNAATVSATSGTAAMVTTARIRSDEDTVLKAEYFVGRLYPNAASVTELTAASRSQTQH